MENSSVSRLTARLDHSVPDPKVFAAVNDDAARRLDELSRILAGALPDHSLSPDERLERLARVVQDRVPERQYLQPALEKVSRLERRLAELVPDPGLTPVERVQALLAHLDDHHIQNNPHFLAAQPTIVQKLERMGDERAGFSPVNNP
ncbi:hypothetical protein [Rhizobium sp. CF142]|uniref:hypothetical protein n=1 Tax=Rhizobium sp. CF142 TaxID=1144314 RepID=UPI00026EFA96|nr:hypothetical protein [Rhizobium sp. CF142]EJJ24604.1 hypothetical protein PMI11_07201 [Rhizobium sp. CF142]